jgi:hypothetical protein
MIKARRHLEFIPMRCFVAQRLGSAFLEMERPVRHNKKSALMGSKIEPLGAIERL